jgi:carotenoid cleavage dioxygenase
MNNPKSFLPDLKELGGLILGFLPWLLFLFISGHTLASLERAIVISLITCLIFGFGDLKRGFILQWGTLIFFSMCAITINLFHLMWMAKYMDLLSNSALAFVMWFTLLTGKPFVLQYARRDLPPERWNDPGMIQGCRQMTIVWASLMSLSVLLSIIRRTSLLSLPGWVYFGLSLVIIAAGLTYTTVFKRRKRLKRLLEQPAGR